MNETYIATYQTSRGLGPWRTLYRDIIRYLPATSILDAGAGSPAFLMACADIPHKAAIDLTADHADAFRSLGATFTARNLDIEALYDLGTFDIIVCSDVFEHLLNPLFALNNLKALLTDDGVLFSHVPNEFAFRKLVRIMLGKKTSVNFHKKDLPEEWTDPHLRRFTDIGFLRMLQTGFAHNIKITRFRSSRFARILHATVGSVPFTFEKGPTYISTNSDDAARRIQTILRDHGPEFFSYL